MTSTELLTVARLFVSIAITNGTISRVFTRSHIRQVSKTQVTVCLNWYKDIQCIAGVVVSDLGETAESILAILQIALGQTNVSWKGVFNRCGKKLPLPKLKSIRDRNELNLRQE